MLTQLWHFVVHLRPHYMMGILSGGYLLGGVLSESMAAGTYWAQFFNVHILLFGGATAYNSWWDRDEGPVGGLKHPPKMKSWMHAASLLLMALGFFWSLTVGVVYSLVYLASLLLFWLYSTPHARWKGRPLLSLFTIAVSTGVNAVLMGTLAAGGAISLPVLLSSAGAAFILLAMYPVSQIFQMEEDRSRGDITFAVKFGQRGVVNFFTAAFFGGLMVLSAGLAMVMWLPALILMIGCTAAGIILRMKIQGLRGVRAEYPNVMRIKALASFSFVFFLLIANVLRHQWFGFALFQEYF
ncbi:MAG: UbiA family prenyltransferase [Balneolaceae bacterium]